LWNTAFFEELEAFPEGDHDDQVDAGADAIEELAADSPWSGDLDKYPSAPRSRMSAEDFAPEASPNFLRARPDHSNDTDRVKRTSRW
jgi:hypothetical protein